MDLVRAWGTLVSVAQTHTSVLSRGSGRPAVYGVFVSDCLASILAGETRD